MARHGRSLIVDAMSSFGALEIDARKTAFDALIAASGKCLEGPPGMAFAIIRRSALELAEGNSHSLAMDLYDQWVYMQKTTQWRYTPPTHVVAALDSAIDQYLKEGGRAARGARYAENCRILIAGLASHGLRSSLAPEIQAPIIVTFHAPHVPQYRFKTFYDAVKAHGSSVSGQTDDHRDIPSRLHGPARRTGHGRSGRCGRGSACRSDRGSVIARQSITRAFRKERPTRLPRRAKPH